MDSGSSSVFPIKGIDADVGAEIWAVAYGRIEAPVFKVFQ